MNTQFERSMCTTDEWYTPLEIIESLGKFDLDPCTPIVPLWQTAEVMYNKNDDGLSKEWKGRVWLNPPYSRPLIEHFIRRLADHGNGIALLFNRCDSKMFQDIIFKKATAMKFLRHRIRFYRPNGTRGDSPGCGSILIAFGEKNAEILKNCNIEGAYLRIIDIDKNKDNCSYSSVKFSVKINDKFILDDIHLNDFVSGEFQCSLIIR